MTQLQDKALEHVDQLLISAHNNALEITKDTADIGEVATKGHQLASDIHDIQMWCRVIKSDPIKTT